MEPTLLGDNLFKLITQLKFSMPETELHILTNGRTFAWPEYAQRFAALEHPKISLGIPLYSDFSGAHDHVVQAKGTFDQTVAGLHQAARNGIRVEVRVVLHKLTLPRLTKLVEYIYRNLTFAEHIALMGLEYTGYTPRNIEELWIDPYDYQDELEKAVEYLAVRNMNVSIYNHQLCVLKPSLWSYEGSPSLIGRLCTSRSAIHAVRCPPAAASFNGRSRNTVTTFTRFMLIRCSHYLTTKHQRRANVVHWFTFAFLEDLQPFFSFTLSG